MQTVNTSFNCSFTFQRPVLLLINDIEGIDIEIWRGWDGY